MLRKMTPQQQVFLEKYLVEKDNFEKAQEVYDIARREYNDITDDVISHIFYDGGSSRDSFFAIIKNKHIFVRMNNQEITSGPIAQRHFIIMEEESSEDKKD